MDLDIKDRNKIFSLLLSLSGYTKNIPAFLELLSENGFHNITENQIRRWRRSEGKGTPVPYFVLNVLFKKFFSEKEKNKEFFLLIREENLGKKTF